MFRDRGGLGLEKEDVNNPALFQEQPALETYREAIQDPHFALRTETREAGTGLPLNFRWVTPTEAEGFEFTYSVPKGQEWLKLSVPAQPQLLINLDGQWALKPVGASILELPCDPARDTLSVQMFAVPPDGRNNVADAYTTQIAEPPKPVPSSAPALAAT